MKTITFHFIVCFLILFTGCRSRIQYVPIESNTVTLDSVVTRDSIIIREEIAIRDSTVTRDSTVIVLDDKGNVIRTELYRERERYRELNSDYILLQAKYDSLLNAKQKEIQVPYPVERELSRWEQFKMDIGGWAIGLLSGIVLFGVGYIIIWLVRRNR